MTDQEGQRDGDPFGMFRLGYSIFTWLSVVTFVALTGVLVWVLFANTAAGTVRSQRRVSIEPTVEAIVATWPQGDLTCETVGEPALPAVCAACHALEGQSEAVVCPTLTEMGKIAEARIADPDYTGEAETALDYIIESIQEPNAYLVADPPSGASYRAGDNSLMPVGLWEQVGPGELNRLSFYLACQGSEPEAVAAGR